MTHYRLGKLGWFNFEDLVQAILKVVIAPGVSAFGGTKDGGRDATFIGSASYPSKESPWSGIWTFQAKYSEYETVGMQGCRKSLINQFPAELSKPVSLLNKPDNYVYVTNVDLTVGNRSSLEKIYSSYHPNGNFAAIDGKDISAFITAYPNIAHRYPQLLGLADLQQMLNKGLYERSKAFLATWQPRLANFVRTSFYDRVDSKLMANKFVVIDGPPESGKTTIAAALSLALATQGYEIIELQQPTEFFEVYEDGRKQLFVADDAIGSISLDTLRNDGWARDLPGIIHRLNKEHLLIWTTRKYILEQAIQSSKLADASFQFPKLNEVVVTAIDLTNLEKAAILFNHAKSSRLTIENRNHIKQVALRIIDHKNFTPEKIRQLIQHLESLEGRGVVTIGDILKFLQNPSQTWVKAYRNLSESEKCLLMSVIDEDGRGAVDDVRRCYDRRISAISQETGLPYTEALGRLENSFLKTAPDYWGSQIVQFQHPTIRDIIITQTKEVESSRRFLIAHSSVPTISALLRGIKAEERKDADADHLIALQTEADFAILLARLGRLREEIVRLGDWMKLFSAAVSMLPIVDPEPKRVENPWELDLEKFGTDIIGRTFVQIASVFARQENFEMNKDESSDAWGRCIKLYYQVNSYLIDPIRPKFLRDLVRRIDVEDLFDCHELLGALRMHEPIFLKQGFDISSLKGWTSKNTVVDEVDEDIGDLRSKQDDGDYFECAEKFAETKDAVENLVEISEKIADLADFEDAQRIREIEQAFRRVEEPPEAPDASDYGELDDRPAGDSATANYWSIGRMFEDL